MRVLITGATGFVGRCLTRVLCAAGDEVVGLAAEEGATPSPGLSALARVDVTDADALATTFARWRPDAVVHLAGLAHVGDSWRRMGEYFQVNVVGTARVLAVARQLPTPPRVVIASSAEVYGPIPEGTPALREDRAVNPASPYALTKAAAEELGFAAARAGLPVVVVRAFNLIGAGQAATFALPSFARQLAAIALHGAEPRLRVGNLSPRRDFLHVEDGARGLATVLHHAPAEGEVYNLASGQARSIEQALDEMIALTGLTVRRELDPDKVRPVDQPLLWGDTNRLQALGWREQSGFPQALAELWDEACREAEVVTSPPAS